MIEILTICELGAAKRSKEKGPENANFSRFLRSLHSAFTRHEKRLQFAPFSVLPPNDS
jgi:hypothetical protein